MAKVSHQVGIVGDINNIYRAIHEPQGLSGWWATKASGSPEQGQVLDLEFAELVTLCFRLEHLRENNLVHFHCVSGPGAWHNSDLVFTLNKDDDQVWVHLVHENNKASEDEFLYFSTKWTCYLLSLRDLIETGKGRPYPNDIKIHFGD